MNLNWYRRWKRKLSEIPRWVVIATGVIFLLALALRVVGLMPNVKHPDETYTEKVVAQLSQTNSLNPKAFKYGSLQFYINLAAVKTVSPVLDRLEQATGFAKTMPDLSHILSRKETRRIVFDSWAMRGLTAFLGALTAALMVWLGKLLFNRYETGLVAALFMAVSPLHTTNSHWITTDVLATLLLYLSLVPIVLIWRKAEEATLKDFLIAGLAMGIAASVRYQPLSLVPYLVAFVLVWRFSWQRLGYLAAGLAAALAGFLIANPFFLVELNQVRYDFATNILPWYRPKVGNWWLHLIPLPRAGLNWWYGKELVRIGTGVSVALLAGVGLVAGFLKRSGAVALILAVVLPNFILVAGYLGPAWERLIIPSIPGLALLAGYGMVEGLELILKRFQMTKNNLLTAALAILVALPQARVSAIASLNCSRASTSQQAHDWISSSLKPEELLARGPQLSVPLVQPKTEQPFHYEELTLGKTMDVASIQALGASYFLINTDLLSRDFTWQHQGAKLKLIPGQYRYEYLALRHWDNVQIPGVRLVKRLFKGELCPDYDIRIYEVGKMPALSEPATVTSYELSDPTNRNLWQLYGEQYLVLGSERLYPTNHSAQGLVFDTESAQITTFRLVGPELAIKKDLYYRYTFRFRVEGPTANQQSKVFANVEVFRKPRNNRIEGEFNAVSPTNSQINASAEVSVLLRSPERGATVVPSLVFELSKPSRMVVESIKVEELTAAP